MYCTEAKTRSLKSAQLRRAWVITLGLIAAGCAVAPKPPPAPEPAPSAPALPPAVPEPLPPSVEPPPSAPAALPPPPATPAETLAASWHDYRMEAARRIVKASGTAAYMSKPVQPLLAIPVMEIHLKEDGSVHEVRVLRRPSQARDTIQLAEAAIRRAGRLGPVAHLPKPWVFTEVFLFDHQRRFKPMSLDH